MGFISFLPILDYTRLLSAPVMFEITPLPSFHIYTIILIDKKG